MGRVSAERLSEQIADDCRKTSGAVPLEKAVAGRLRNAIGFDAWCVLTVDPALVMSTGGYHDEGVAPNRVPQLVQIEASGEDFNALATIARRPSPVATLARATGGELERSRRYTEVIAPSGLKHELRATFRTESGTWGAVIMFRAVDAEDFSDAELQLVERATREVAAAVRRELVLSEIEHSDALDGPGLVLLDAQLAPIHATPTAERWFSEIIDGVDRVHGIPYAVMTAATRARAKPGAPVRSRLRTRGGRWITLHAEQCGEAGGNVSVIVEPARPTEIADLVADAYGLTARERQVVRLLAVGYSRAEIAQQLIVSQHTVDDHVKNVFAKLEVSNRSQLTAKLFFDQNLPRIHEQVPIGGTGWFIR